MYVKRRKSGTFQMGGRELKGYNDEDIVISCENIRCETK